MVASPDPFSARDTLATGEQFYRIDALGDPLRLPYPSSVLLENLLRRAGSEHVSEADVQSLASWPEAAADSNLAFMPPLVIMQDLTGVPAVVDLAAMRAAVARAGGDPARVDPLVPVDLVIDHSVQVDAFGSDGAYARNIEREYERNGERYQLLRWAQRAFRNFRVVPPGMGICHQLNLEYLGRVVQVRDGVALSDTLVGTDSHTTMINAIGVLGWGVGGIEAEAGMLGQPSYFPVPEVVGVKLVGELPYGATCGFFPVDDESLAYMRLTGRSEEQIRIVETYCKVNGLFFDPALEPVYTKVVEINLSEIEANLSGPKRPQDLIPLSAMKKEFNKAITAPQGNQGFGFDEKE